jgi:hypothetical protein
MNFSRTCGRRILSALVGLVLVAAPLMVSVAAADSDDIAAYQAYTSQRDYPPPAPYAAPSMGIAQRNELQARLNYAEAQYEQARRAGDRAAAKHWRKQVKHLSRELYGERHAEGPGYGAPALMPPAGPAYPPPAFYGPPAQPYAAPGYVQQPYPPPGYPSAGYPPSGGYPTTGYPSYSAPAAAGSTGGLSSLLGPLMGGGAAPYPGYPQSPNGAVGNPYGGAGGIGALLGPLLGAAPVR